MIRLMLPALLVGLLTAWVQSPVLECQALSFDDHEYLTLNQLVTNPSGTSVGRFFGEVLEPSTVAGYYQPLTMVSLMIDYAAGGRPDHLKPFHRTGLLIHAINAALLVILIYQLTGHVGAGVAMGLLFGCHPAATEVLPWIAQRKTLLATLFALACLISYVSWTRRRGFGRLGASLLFYVLALLSKPTAVPLVVVLMVLDWWPLGRWNRRTLIEKLPFALVGAIFAVITIVSQARTGGTVSSVEESAWKPLLIVGYTTSFYLRQLFWPVGWPGYYVFPEPFTPRNPVVFGYLAASVGGVVAVLVSCRWIRAPAASAAMFFALLFPTMGVIGFTEVIAANRFLYTPMIAVLLLIGYALSLGRRSTGEARKVPVIVRGLAVGMIVLLCVGEASASRSALVPWRNTLSLFAHLSTDAPDAPKVRYNHGNALSDAGRTVEAVREYEAAIALRPEFDQAHNNLAVELDALGQTTEAIRHFETAISLNPRNARSRNSYGAVLLKHGAIAEAVVQLREALRINPEFTEAYFNLGVGMMELQDWAGAAEALEQVLRRADRDAQAMARLGYVYERLNRLDEAVSFYRQAVALDPSDRIAVERLEQLTRPDEP